MEILYANGDSFVFGMECIENFSQVENNKELAFPKKIADKLNCKTYINNAYNGATNEFIFRTTIFDLLELESQGISPSEVFVVIGWTSLNRFEIDSTAWLTKQVPDIATKLHTKNTAPEHVDYNTLFINPNFHAVIVNSKSDFSIQKNVLPFLVDYVWHEHMQLPQQEARLIALHGFLTAKGYRHLFLNTCGSCQFEILDPSIKNFYNFNIETFYEWASKNYPYTIRKNNHFDPTPHAAYGALLVDYIRENIL